MFLAALVLGIMGGGLLVSAHEEAQFGQRRQVWLRIGTGGPLMVVALAALWLGITHPNLADVPDDEGFGLGWVCQPLGDATFCDHDPFVPSTLDQPHH